MIRMGGEASLGHHGQAPFALTRYDVVYAIWV